MVGYGFEDDVFVLELTYNYGVNSYELGNEFGGVTIKSKEAIERAKANKYPHEENADGSILLRAPDGFKFFILNENPKTGEDPIQYIIYNSTNLDRSIKYWNGILNMKIIRQNDRKALLSYNEGRFGIEFSKIDVAIDRAQAYGRIAFGVPFDLQPSIDEMIKKNNQTILTPLVSLDTPGKATVRVIILADPDGHEICFVDDESFTQLSAFDPEAEAQMDKYIQKDPFQQ